MNLANSAEEEEAEDEVSDLFSAIKRKYGLAKHSPIDAEIFTGEGDKFWKHVKDRGWTQAHVPIWCLDVIDARAKQGAGNNKKGPQATSTLGPVPGQTQEKAQRTPCCVGLPASPASGT